MKVYMGAYEGRSAISWTIQRTTRHWCSHISAISEDGRVIESWHRDGVVEREHFSLGHTPRTPIHLYEMPHMTPQQQAKLWRGMMAEVGKKYDWRAILSFATRSKSKHNPDKWICSELFCQKARAADHAIQIAPAFVIPPAWCVRSPRVTYVGTVHTGYEPSSAALSHQWAYSPPLPA